tara:strand:+ start:27 stop:788 length:762 start_codon:yes stop_codon:yes gene_type:complete
MKKIIISTLLLFNLCFCVDREEIISRHENGNKKLLVKYTGIGSNEVIVERITYLDNNLISKIERPIENSEIRFQYFSNMNIKSKETYKFNKKDGDCLYYSEDGELIEEKKYKNGNVSTYYGNGQIKSTFDEESFIYSSFYENGQLKLKTSLINNHIHGQYTSYYENGQLEISTVYQFSKIIGSYISYYKNGQTKIESNYSNGLLNGPYIFYSDSGKILEKGEYYKNQKQGKWILTNKKGEQFSCLGRLCPKEY